MSDTNVGYGVSDGTSGRRVRRARQQQQDAPSYLEAGPHRLAKTKGSVNTLRPEYINPGWSTMKHHARGAHQYVAQLEAKLDD